MERSTDLFPSGSCPEKGSDTGRTPKSQFVLGFTREKGSGVRHRHHQHGSHHRRGLCRPASGDEHRLDPSGSDTPTIVSAYQNEVMAQFPSKSAPYQKYGDGSSISTDGGNTFSTLSPDMHLPDGPSGETCGDNGNPVLARDPTTGKIYLATTSAIQGGHPDIQVFESTRPDEYRGYTTLSE